VRAAVDPYSGQGNYALASEAAIARNWSCKDGAAASRSVTHRGPATRPCYSVEVTAARVSWIGNLGLSPRFLNRQQRCGRRLRRSSEKPLEYTASRLRRRGRDSNLERPVISNGFQDRLETADWQVFWVGFARWRDARSAGCLGPGRASLRTAGGAEYRRERRRVVRGVEFAVSLLAT
jgi:hypothetical protein